MARRRRASSGRRRRSVGRALRSRIRRPRRNGMKALAKKAGIGAIAGLAVSIPLSLLAKRQGDPRLLEIAQRGGAVASAHFGQGPGALAFQVADVLFDKFVVYENTQISGGGTSLI